MAETHAVLNVPTVSCNHCKMAIETAVGALDGVGEVTVDVAEKTVTVDFDTDALSLESIEEAVAGEGYEVVGRHVFGA
jgi:copper chaperone